MSFSQSFLSSIWSSSSEQSPATSFGSNTFEIRRSRSRRRSSPAEGDRYPFKSAKTHAPYDALVYRRRAESEAFCRSCHDLDLKNIFASRRQIRSASGEFIVYLNWAFDPTCALCSLVTSMQVPQTRCSTDRNCAGKEEAGYHLRAFSGMVSYREYFLRAPPNRRTNDSSDTMLAVVPNGLFSGTPNLKSRLCADIFGSVGYILPVASSSTSPWLAGRRVHPTHVNFAVIQEWLQHCKKNHSCAMRFSRPSQLRMIDCKTLKIVIAPPNCNYFALSYVWGAAPTCSPPSNVNSSLPSEPGDLLSTAAPVIRDAIKVVQSLGWRYLWVDKYCVPQSDPMLKAEQIGRMDLIYEGAYCTIVAASGESDRDGLPGISIPRRRQPSVTLEHQEAQFVSSLPDPQAVIRSSIWNTRAWTFQEAHCSARRLIFTHHQVYFECKALHTCEAVELPLSLITGAHARPVLFRDEWLTGTYRFGALSAFWSAVKAYSQRTMTFETDALTALEGILRRFQSSPAFVYNILGIPLVLDNGSRGDKDSLLDVQLFVAGLSWHHSVAARRRKHFPSWTWAGWDGSVQLQRTFGGAGYTSNVRLWVQNAHQVTFPWEMFWDGFWRPEGKARCYGQFECLIVEADLFKVQLRPKYPERGQSLQSDKGTLAVFDMVSPYDPAILYSSVIMPLDLGRSTKVVNELWDCMLLGTRLNSGNPDIMLLRFNIDSAERIWTGPLWPETASRVWPRNCLPPTIRRRFKMT